MYIEPKIVVGDATNPENLGKTKIVIPHCCNDCEGGAWGSGFVIAINKAFGLNPKKYYHQWAKGENFEARAHVKVTGSFILGEVQFVKIPNLHLVIANMIGQHGVGFKDGRAPIRYSSLSRAMIHVRDFVLGHKAEIHMPRFGSGLAAGNEDTIMSLVREIWSDFGINVVVYDFPEK